MKQPAPGSLSTIGTLNIVFGSLFGFCCASFLISWVTSVSIFGDLAQDNLERYLPLTESTYYILLALVAPLHGYAVMQRIEGMSEGHVRVGAGTLYNAIPLLLKEGLIAQVEEALDQRAYFRPAARAEASRLTMRNVLTAPGWNHLEVRTMRGIVRYLTKPPGQRDG